MEEIATPAAPAKSRAKRARTIYYLITSNKSSAKACPPKPLLYRCDPHLRRGSSPEDNDSRHFVSAAARELLTLPRQERFFDSRSECTGYKKALDLTQHAVLISEAELAGLQRLAELVKPCDFTRLASFSIEALDQAIKELDEQTCYSPYPASLPLLHEVRAALAHPELEIAAQDLQALCGLPLWKQIEPLLDPAALLQALQLPEEMGLEFDRVGIDGQLIFTPSEDVPGAWHLRYTGSHTQMLSALEQMQQAGLARPLPLRPELRHALHHLGVWPADATQENLRRYLDGELDLTSLGAAALHELCERGMAETRLSCTPRFSACHHGELVDLLAKHSRIVVQNSGGRTSVLDVRQLLLPVICGILQVEPTSLEAVEVLAPAGGPRRALLECNAESITLRLERVEHADELRAAIGAALEKNPQDGWHLLPVTCEVNA